MIVGIAWPTETLTELESDDWGPPTYPSYVVTTCHKLRYKPLEDFTAEDLRLMVGQEISLPSLMPMALDVLELVDPFAGGDMNRGTLLLHALSVDKSFWQKYPTHWYRMTVILVDLYFMREFIENELMPAAEAFKLAKPIESTTLP